MLKESHDWLQNKRSGQEPRGHAIQYTLPRRDVLTRYCENGALHNLSEPMVRPIAISRKNHLISAAITISWTPAIPGNIIADAKSNRVEPFACVRDLLTMHNPLKSGVINGGGSAPAIVFHSQTNLHDAFASDFCC